MPSLGFGLGAELGDDDDPYDLIHGHVADWQARLRSRIYEQFKGKPNLQAVVDAFAEQVQQLEDSGAALTLLASIDPVTDDPDSPLYAVGRGAQLQTIGRMVGQRYTGEADEIYRLRLRARIRANNSSGTPEHLYAVFVALFAGAASAKILPSPPAGMVFRVLTAIDGITAAVLISFLHDAKLGGVRLDVEWQQADASLMFCFAGGTGLGFGDATDSSVGGELAGAVEA